MVYNSTFKDDPPAIPLNTLYLVNPQLISTDPIIAAKYQVSLKMAFPNGEDPMDWICAAFWGIGTKVPGSDAPFDSTGLAIMIFDHYPPPGLPPVSNTYEIMVGKIMYVDNMPVLDPNGAFFVTIPALGNQLAQIEAHPYEDYAYSWSIVYAGATTEGGWYKGMPNASHMLRIFRDGNANDLSGGYAPSLTRDINFNCFSGEFSEWLTHDAGAPFALNGSVILKEYVWGTDKNFSILAANAPQFRDKEQELWDNILPSLLITWQNQPIGYAAWTDWYEIETPYDVTLDDLNPPTKNDLYATFARVRVKAHRVQFYAQKTGADTIIKSNFNATGDFIDLYDFNIKAGFPADVAAVVQLGYGIGNKDVTGGQIFRSRFLWSYP